MADRRLLLIRHCDSSGHEPSSELTERGLSQAQYLTPNPHHQFKDCKDTMEREPKEFILCVEGEGEEAYAASSVIWQ